MSRPRRLAILGLLLASLAVAGSLGRRHVSAWYHFRAGSAALESYHNREALTHLQASLEVRPAHADSLLLAARAAWRLGDFDLSEAYLKGYADTHPDPEALALERALLRAARGEVDEVGDYCGALLAKGDSAAPLVYEALVYGQLRAFRPQGASLSLLGWLQRQPDNTQALLFKGMLAEQRQDPQEAISSFRRVLDLDPDLDQARLLLAGVLLDLTQAREALPHLEYLRQRQPDNALVKVRLARALDLLGRSPEAEALLDEVLAAQPRDAAALAERGKLALRAGRPAEAEPLLRSACALAPGDHAAHHQWYRSLVQLGKKAEAAATLERMNQIEADTRQLREITMGRMHLAPHSPALQCELGTLLLRSGDVEGGLRWLNSALREDAQCQEAHRALADFYERVGQHGRAEGHRLQAGPR